MPSNFSVKKVYDICEYGCFDVKGDFHCQYQNKKLIDVRVSDQPIKRYSCCPKTYSDGEAICFKFRTV